MRSHAYDKNFAGQLPFIDALMGTLFVPERAPRTNMAPTIPCRQLYHEQLAYPFVSAGRHRRGPVPGPPALGESTQMISRYEDIVGKAAAELC